jgi:UDP-glucose 4-epimerase
MNILVTGGAGFVGTNLVKRLLINGHNVVSIDNYSTGLESNHQSGVNYIKGDITEIKDYSVYGEFDVVFHMAAIARIQPSFDRPLDYFQTNALATMYISQYCVNKNIPLIFAGSSSHHSGKFKNPYTYSKDIGEEIIQLYQKHFNLKSTIARFYNVYGPHHLKSGGYCTLIGTWESAIENSKHLTIYGDGSKRRDFTHVDDIVDALIKIHENEVWGEVFELGRGKNYSVIEIANMFKQPYVFANDKPGEAQETLCVDSLAKVKLSWNPKRNIEDYIIDYLNKK